MPPLRSQIHTMLESLGISSSSDYDRACEVVESELARVQIAATFASLRRGELIIEATPQDAALLRYDVEVIAARLHEAIPGVITSVRVRPRRFSSTSPSTPDHTI